MGRKPVAGCLDAVEALVYDGVPDVDLVGLPCHDAVCHATADTAVPDNNVVRTEQLDAVVIAVDVAAGDVDITTIYNQVGNSVQLDAAGTVIASGLVTHGNVLEHEMLGLVVTPGPEAPDRSDAENLGNQQGALAVRRPIDDWTLCRAGPAEPQGSIDIGAAGQVDHSAGCERIAIENIGIEDEFLRCHLRIKRLFQGKCIFRNCGVRTRDPGDRDIAGRQKAVRGIHRQLEVTCCVALPDSSRLPA